MKVARGQPNNVAGFLCVTERGQESSLCASAAARELDPDSAQAGSRAPWRYPGRRHRRIRMLCALETLSEFPLSRGDLHATQEESAANRP